MNPLHNVAHCFHLTCSLAGLAILLESISWLRISRQFKGDGIYAWDLVQRRGRFPTVYRCLPQGLSTFIGFPGPIWLFASRIALALVVVFSWNLPFLRAVAFWLLLVTGAVQLVRSYTVSGAESNLRTVISCLAISHISPESEFSMEAALWFIGFHTVLCYAANGWAKARASKWRDGKILHLISLSEVFGNDVVASGLGRHRLAAKITSNVTIIFLCLSPLALFLGFPGALVFVCCALTFHAINSAFLGLGLFLFSFAIGYPAMLFLSLRIHELILGGPGIAPFIQ